jgi:hypothetical protein
LSFYEGVGVGVLKIEESESEVLKIEESESDSDLLCTDSTALREEAQPQRHTVLVLHIVGGLYEMGISHLDVTLLIAI